MRPTETIQLVGKTSDFDRDRNDIFVYDLTFLGVYEGAYFVVYESVWLRVGLSTSSTFIPQSITDMHPYIYVHVYVFGYISHSNTIGVGNQDLPSFFIQIFIFLI